MGWKKAEIPPATAMSNAVTLTQGMDPPAFLSFSANFFPPEVRGRLTGHTDGLQFRSQS